MKKALRVFACFALVFVCTAAAAVEMFFAESLADDTLAQYSVEELFEMYDRIVYELSLRQYPENGIYTYVLNEKTDKFHSLGCVQMRIIDNDNRGIYTGAREELLIRDYEPCGACNP